MSKLALLGGEPILKEPLPNYNSIGEEEKQAVLKAMDNKLSGFVGRWGDYFLGGPNVRELEKQFQDYFDVKYAVSFNSATTALQAAVAALGIGPGDQVITSPYTMSATPSSILANNAVPVFADIEEQTFCLSPESIEKNITDKTKAIMVVNLFGGTANYDKILEIAQKHNLKIIEDNAQSPGAEHNGKLAGTIGDIGVFSLNNNKVIQCGEGGVLITNNPKYALRAQLVRNHGEVVADDLVQQDKDFEPILGNNFRLTEIQAAIGSEQFRKLDKFNEQRIELANYLTEKLKQFDWLVPAQTPFGKHVYFIYPFRFLSEKIGISRQLFAKAVQAENLMVAEGYQKPLYLLPCYQQKRIFPHSQFPFISSEYPQEINYQKGICPTAEKMHFQELLITTICQPPQTKNEIDLFIEAIQKIQNNLPDLKNHQEN